LQWAEFRDAKHDLFVQTGGDVLLLGDGGSMDTLLLADGGAGGYVPPPGADFDEAI
jgi:hypothetical protein